MDNNASNIRIEKLNYSNFHSWKQKIELVLGHRDVDDMVDPTLCPPRPDASDELSKWIRRDKTARMTIGISLSDEMLKNVRHTTTALEMWNEICNVHQRHTLLNKLSARREFYTATMEHGEKMLVYINRVRQMASVLESMGVDIDDKEMAMAVLNGLPKSFRTLITALDAIGDDDPSFTFDKVRSRLLQEERRSIMLTSSRPASQSSALINQSPRPGRGLNRKHCTHCNKTNHTEPYCWEKYGRPTASRGKGSRKTSGPSDQNTSANTAVIASEVDPKPDIGSTLPDSEFVCLMTSAIAGPDSRRKATTWHIDSAATSHMTFDRSVFASYEALNPFPVTMGDKSTSIAVGRGDVHLPLLVNGVVSMCKLQDVLHVPSFVFSLVSVSTLTKRGFSVRFTDHGVNIMQGDSVVAMGTHTRGLYSLDIGPTSHSTEVACAATLELWHERMGHVHNAGISHMAKHSAVEGLDISPGGSTTAVCEGCVAGKMPRAPIPRSSSTRATGLLDLVHSDIAGPMEVSSKGGARYFVTFIDDKSRWLTVYPLKLKSDCFASFQAFHLCAETATGRKIRQLRSDGGGEYFSTEFNSFLDEHGIQRQTTCAYTPQQNGVAERMNRTLKDLARAMLHHKGIAYEFWAEALSCAAYIRNRVTSRSLPSNTTPFEIWFGRKPNVSHLRVFGSECWYKVPDELLRTLDRRARPAVMLGYAEMQKGYKLWDDVNNQIVISRDVVFKEKPSTHVSHHPVIPEDDSILPDEDYSPNFEPGQEQSPESSEAEDQVSSPPDSTQDPAPSSNPDTPPVPDHDATDPNTPTTPLPSTIPNQRKSSRTRKPPSAWWKAVAHVSTAPTSTTPEHLLTFTEATKGEESHLWREAIASEMDSLRKNQTWVLVPRSEAHNLLSSKWVFKRKETITDSGAHSLKHKARLVTRGFQQKYGVDYEETYAPVVKFCTLRMLFAMVVHHQLHCDQMDVKTAFLYGELEQDIYMEQPEGFVDPKRPGHVCKLQKALYGLKQAPRQWHAKIDAFLIDELHFQSSPYDPCLYVQYQKGSMVIIALYVDDLVLACSDRQLLDWLKEEFCKRFEMKDCGEVRVCLGLEIVRDTSKVTLHLSQQRYVDKVLERFDMTDAKPVVTPMHTQISAADIEGELVDSTLYRSAVGSLMYLAVGTRPDIAFAVGRLAQHVEKPTKSLWVAVKRVLRYIAGTRSVGILYQGSISLTPIAYSDSDWGGCTLNRKSTSGYVFLMAGGAVSWKSKKQGCVAQSSSEAEYMALSAAVKEAIWLSNLVGFSSAATEPSPILINVDNQGSIKMAKNDASGTRTKHIDIQYHFVRDSLAEGLFSIDYCPTSEMAADLLTKPLARTLLEKFKNTIGLRSIAGIEHVTEGGC